MAFKDSAQVIEFMTLYHKLRDWIDDEPVALEELAITDGSIRELCLELAHKVFSLELDERQNPLLFVHPVDQKFIDAWRDYEERFAAPIAGVFLTDLGLDFADDPRTKQSELDFLWEVADDKAKERAFAIELAIDHAFQSSDDRLREFPEGFSEKIENGVRAWENLARQVGFDLRGVFRRRELVPFVMIPRQVANKYGSAEHITLYTNLKQAHDAFVFGVPFAAIALMRSVLELTLRDHYNATGDDLAEMIENSRNLPNVAMKVRLHKLRALANDILHVRPDSQRIPKDLEKELLSYFIVLRKLIEGAPKIHRPIAANSKER